MRDATRRARGLLAEAMQVHDEALPDDASIENVGEWNSLSHMRLMLALEATLGEELDPATIVELTSLDGIARLLADRA